MAKQSVENRGERARGGIALALDRARAQPVLVRLRSGCVRWDDLTARERRSLAGAPLVEYLLETSYGFRFEDPLQMVALAKVACAVADALSRRRYGREIVADLRARAWGELGNAYRVADDFEEAGRAFDRAQKLAGEGTRSASLLARVSEIMASYCADLRDFPQAISLLERARDSYRECKDQAGLERSLLQLAHTLGLANEPERSLVTYLEALRQMSPGSANWLPMIHGLATYLVECGFFDLAARLLERHEWQYRRAGKLTRCRLFWLQGRIAVGLHQHGKAEGKLQTARLAFLRENQAFDASLVTLDLAWVFARQGRRSEVAWLVEQMLRTFKSLGIARESYASMVLLKQTCEEQRSAEVVCVQIEALAKLLPELASPARAMKQSDK